MSDRLGADAAQKYARVAALLLFVTMLAGGFGEMYVPSKLVVRTDATATAENLRNAQTLFRAGFAAYLVEAICDITLAWIFLVLLRPVHRPLALLAAFFGLVSTAVFAAGEIFYFCSSLVLRDDPYLAAFSAAQRNAIVLLGIRTYGLASGVFMVFYGIASLIRGWLMFRSGYFPKLVGTLFALAGVGFSTRAFLLVLAPRYASSFLLLPMFLAVLTTIVWLMVRGIDAEKWERAVATSDPT